MPDPYKYVVPEDTTETQHEGTSHLAINNTLFRRFMSLLAFTAIGPFYSRDGPCVPISNHLIVKKSPFVHLTEAATLQFIAEKTSIPVPRVHCAFVHKNRAYIVMQRIQGISMAEALPSLSVTERSAIFEQLRGMIDELRALPPPPNVGVQSCIGGSLSDSRIPRSNPRFGPFESTEAFHLWLRADYKPEEHPDGDNQDWHDLKDLAAWHNGPWPAPVFTHGDLNPFNVFVRDGRVVGIIDWEFSGWYPYYWEYTAAWYGHRTRTAWQDLLPEFLQTYPEELKMEIIRQKWWGDF